MKMTEIKVGNVVAYKRFTQRMFDDAVAAKVIAVGVSKAAGRYSTHPRKNAHGEFMSGAYVAIEIDEFVGWENHIRITRKSIIAVQPSKIIGDFATVDAKRIADEAAAKIAADNRAIKLARKNEVDALADAIYNPAFDEMMELIESVSGYTRGSSPLNSLNLEVVEAIVAALKSAKVGA